ncbi:MAG: TatD family hydrolase [Candidatus Omnitrophota bacterium]
MNEIRFFDSHHHLNDPILMGREESVWLEAVQAGVARGAVVGYDLESSRRAVEQAQRYPGLYAAVGVSPHAAAKAANGYIEELRTLAAHPKVCAIGEAGLEYHYPSGPKEMQIERFCEQSRLANELGKILIVHLREADEDFLRILESDPPAAAILHCFTASQTVMEKAAALGYFISFSGILTFKNAKEMQRIASLVPEENLLIETDAPYLAPIPYRGGTCEPKMLVETAKKLAELRGVTLENIGALTFQNACRAFSVDSF